MWTKNMEKKKTYPTLSKDIKTEIVIVGGGITGALTAHYFMKQGMRCVLVDKSNIATHATSASTAILKYEIKKSHVTSWRAKCPTCLLIWISGCHGNKPNR